MDNPSKTVALAAYRDSTLASPTLTPAAIALYNEQARRLEDRKRHRPLWKTIIFGGLLYTLTPLGGNAIAQLYVHTRNNPAEFKFGQAWATGWIAFFCFLTTWALIFGVFWVGASFTWLGASIAGFFQDGGQVSDLPRYIYQLINQLLQGR